MVELDIGVRKCHLLAVLVDNRSRLQLFQFAQNVVQIPEHVRGIVHVLHPREDGEREEREHYEDPELHLPGQGCERCDRDHSNTCKLDGAEVRDIERRETVFDIDALRRKVVYSLGHRLHRRVLSPVALGRGKPAHVFDDSPCQTLGRLMGLRSQPGAFAVDSPQCQRRQPHADKRD